LAEAAFRIDEESTEEEFRQVAIWRLTGPDALLLKEENALELCESMIDITATLFNIPSKDLRLPGRSTLPITRVRQVAIYVAHVALGLTMAEVGRGFGRDRKTVQHACHIIEDLRDDADFDRVVGQVERIAAIALRNRIGR
jgi:chromosomal replication initiation ATPase DnaA